MQTRQSTILKKNSYDPQTRSCQAVAATENPVEVYSFERGAIVKEILLMSGAELPDRVPLLDTHDRYSTGKILGSADGFTVNGPELHCRISISEKAETTAVKIAEGHLTDLSIGYEVVDARWIDEGKTEFIGARSYTGPVLLTTRWRVKELSVCPIGADEKAKIRSYQPNNSKENIIMNETTTKTETEIRADERTRVADISAMGERYGCRQLAETLINNGASFDEARVKVFDFIEKTRTEIAPSFRAEAGAMDWEKRSAAMIDGVCIRAGHSLKDVAPGAEDFAGHNLKDIARESLTMQGVRVSGLSGSRLIEKALQTRSHSTSDFPYILSGVSEKTLRDAYAEAPGTFTIWTNPSSATNFKDISRVQLSEAGDLSEVPDGAEYRYGTFGESAETYAIVTLGEMFSITRQALINDDLGALVRVPRAFSMAAKRTLNKRVYDILDANAAMNDGIALFNATHSNVGDSGTINIDNLSAARAAMRTQTGIAGEILNIAPKFLIVPAELETLADQVLNTMSGLEATEGAGAINPFYKKLEVVVEPLIDSFSGCPWYLAANPLMIDTVEVAYLNGQQTPYLQTRDGWTVDGVEYKIRLDAGAKAIDWRGLFRVESDSES